MIDISHTYIHTPCTHRAHTYIYTHVSHKYSQDTLINIPHLHTHIHTYTCISGYISRHHVQIWGGGIRKNKVIQCYHIFPTYTVLRLYTNQALYTYKDERCRVHLSACRFVLQKMAFFRLYAHTCMCTEKKSCRHVCEYVVKYTKKYICARINACRRVCEYITCVSICEKMAIYT